MVRWARAQREGLAVFALMAGCGTADEQVMFDAAPPRGLPAMAAPGEAGLDGARGSPGAQDAALAVPTVLDATLRDAAGLDAARMHDAARDAAIEAPSDAMPAPSDAAAPGVLPDDPAIFGDAVVAMYLFRAAYVTTSGDPPVVTSLVNAHDPGTHDVTFVNPPLWIADCGQDAAGRPHGCARFDGVDDHGEGHGFALVTGDRPSLIAVLKMNDVTDVTAIPFQLTNDAGSQFMNLPEVRTQGENLWRYNGSFTSPPHNIDFGMPDLGLHLHEQHLASPSTLAIFDGVTQEDRGGDSGVTGPITKVSLGRRAPFEYAAVDIFEALVVDRPSLAQAREYRERRVRAEYPTIALP